MRTSRTVQRRFRAALERHCGISNTSPVMGDIWSAGYYGGDDKDYGQRLTRPLPSSDNGYARPIEGIRPVVDLNTMTVIRVEEYGNCRRHLGRQCVSLVSD